MWVWLPRLRLRIRGEEGVAQEGALRCRPLEMERGLRRRDRGLASLGCRWGLRQSIICVGLVLTVVSGPSLAAAVLSRDAEQRGIRARLGRRPLRSGALQLLLKRLRNGPVILLCLSSFNVFLYTSLVLLIQSE